MPRNETAIDNLIDPGRQNLRINEGSHEYEQANHSGR